MDGQQDAHGDGVNLDSVGTRDTLVITQPGRPTARVRVLRHDRDHLGNGTIVVVPEEEVVETTRRLLSAVVAVAEAIETQSEGRRMSTAELARFLRAERTHPFVSKEVLADLLDAADEAGLLLPTWRSRL